MPVIASTATREGAQADGRAWCNETHLISDGTSVDYRYLATPDIDIDAVALERVASVNLALNGPRSRLG